MQHRREEDISRLVHNAKSTSTPGIARIERLEDKFDRLLSRLEKQPRGDATTVQSSPENKIAAYQPILKQSPEAEELECLKQQVQHLSSMISGSQAIAAYQPSTRGNYYRDNKEEEISRLKEEIRKLKAPESRIHSQRETSTEPAAVNRLTQDLTRAFNEIQRMQSRMDGFMRTYASKLNRQEQQRSRTRDGRPICDICGRIGHVRQNYFSPNDQRNQSPGQQHTQQARPRIAVIEAEATNDPVVAQFNHQHSTTYQTQAAEQCTTPLVESQSDCHPPIPPQSDLIEETESIPVKVDDTKKESLDVQTTITDPHLNPIVNAEEYQDDNKTEETSPLPTACSANQEQDITLKPRDLSLYGNIANCPVKLLVDTGASITVINAAFFRNIPSSQPLKTTTSSVPAINTVSGERLPILGQVILPLEIDSRCYHCRMYVIEDLGFEAVLGRDFLEEKGAVIDFRNGTVQLTDQDPITKEPVIQTVRAVATYVIPPRAEAIVPAHLEQSSPHNLQGLIEPSSQLAHKYCLQGASCLVTSTPEGDVPFRILNPTAKPVTIHQGTTLGAFTTLDEIIATPLNQSKSTSHKNQSSNDLTSHIDFSHSTLTADQQQALLALLKQYRDVFALSPEELGRTDVIKYTIDTGNSPPIRLRPYRLPETKKAVVDQHVNDMLKRGIIRESTSPWSAPIVLVSKKDGGERFCLDYRRLNKITTKDSFPLPRVDSTLDALSNTKFFSTVDLISGYWQCELAEEAKEKTAFITHRGLYEFEVLPFGLVNGPNFFQRIMECVLRGLTYEICLVYLDDVIVFSRTFEEHLVRLEQVFKRFRDANIKLKPSKCHFGCQKVNFLGHVVTAEGVHPDPQKVSAVKEFPVPRNVKQVRSFLGLCNYYRKFVRDFAKIAEPLNKLTRKDTVFNWNEACQQAFDTLKTALIEAPILAYPDFNLHFELYVDASNDGIGMVLGQIQNGREVVICYAGRGLNQAERNYSVTEREALSVVEGIKYFQSYLYGRKFTVHTDHNALKWLMQIRDPTGRLARWSLLLQQYDYSTKYSTVQYSTITVRSTAPASLMVTQMHYPEDHTTTPSPHWINQAFRLSEYTSYSAGTPP